jgi:hypothetical protein
MRSTSMTIFALVYKRGKFSVPFQRFNFQKYFQVYHPIDHGGQCYDSYFLAKQLAMVLKGNNMIN